METVSRRWLTPDWLKEDYGFSKSSQGKMRMKKTIPYSKVGGYVRYDRFEIDKWLEMNTVVGVKL